MRTGKSIPLALMAGRQTRVRNVLREMGVPAVVVKQRLISRDVVGCDVVGDGVEPVVVDAEGSGEVAFGVGLADVAFAGGGVCFDTSMMVSSTVTVLVRKSMWRGRRAMSSPHRMPVSMAVSTRSR
jgi:hypothetical protein